MEKVELLYDGELSNMYLTPVIKVSIISDKLDPIGFRVQCLNHSAITALNNFKTSEKSAKHQAQNHKPNTFYLMREELYYTLILHVGSWISP